MTVALHGSECCSLTFGAIPLFVARVSAVLICERSMLNVHYVSWPIIFLYR